ncbi:hypothetical protein GPECTOR_7g1058 [Gonium pectorale]|uniref:Protein kinase domain-containing protein n=1 Tax=Gonium pectorale TaxID=33097 RepID=A0A150GTG5_GONPE|nr:hypothetical protein GPECTOR_7g1058 [Gonium pectorale]|eukprot:KXZ53166.1 hypothetical protein GPECTOR_7g1058 [Gonium pectorale]
MCSAAAAGPLNLRLCNRLLVQLAEATAALGRAGVVNADAKPQNTTVTAAGQVQLIDLDGATFVMPEDCRAQAAAMAEARLAHEEVQEAAADLEGAEAQVLEAMVALALARPGAVEELDGAEAQRDRVEMWREAASDLVGLTAAAATKAMVGYRPTVITDCFAPPEALDRHCAPFVCVASNVWLFGASAAYLVGRVRAAAGARTGGAPGLSRKEAAWCDAVATVADECMVREPWLRPDMDDVAARLR